MAEVMLDRLWRMAGARPNFTRRPLASITPWEISLALSLQGRGKDGRIQLYLMPSVNFADVSRRRNMMPEPTIHVALQSGRAKSSSETAGPLCHLLR